MGKMLCSIDMCREDAVSKYKDNWYCIDDLISVMRDNGETEEKIKKKLKVLEIHTKFKLAELRALNKIELPPAGVSVRLKRE